VVEAVIAENPRAVEDYAAGRVKAVEFLLGQVLRRVQARAKPNQVRSLLVEELDRSREMPR
jgi:aspartyl-tRNA(Asn)/glutamyl-tRNA(Gln) amidotransferase subunit B